MMIPAQSRMARAALGWTAADLATRAGIGTATVARFENGQATPIPATLAAMQRAFEAEGIKFMEPGERPNGGYGIRLTGLTVC